MTVEVKDLPQLAEELKKRTDEVKAIAEEFNGKAAKGEKLSQDAKEAADVAMTKLNELRAQVEELEQKAARRKEEQTEAKSLGDQFVESDSFKSLAGSASQRGRADMQVKATITSVTTDTAGAAGDLVSATRLPGIVSPQLRRMTVRDLITPGRMDGNTLEYVKETGFTNAAAGVAEGAAKPQSDLKFDLVSTTAKVIAHHMKASRQILSDASMLASYINERMLYMLRFVEENQLLNGNGTGQNLLGIVPQATAYAAPYTPSGTPTAIDMIRLAALQALVAEFPATGVVLNPIDWDVMVGVKDTTGRYIIGNPQGTASPTLWGLPVVATNAMAEDKFLVGAFRLGAQVFDRWLARVEVATENEDDFVKNLVTILCEERIALAVYRPQAFIFGDLGRVP